MLRSLIASKPARFGWRVESNCRHKLFASSSVRIFEMKIVVEIFSRTRSRTFPKHFSVLSLVVLVDEKFNERQRAVRDMNVEMQCKRSFRLHESLQMRLTS